MKKSEKLPLISVIITCYNYGKYVREAVESVLNQTYKNIEIIIINDGSTDESDDVIKGILHENPDRKIQYVNQKNKGVVFSRNRGMAFAKGKYLCCLDADDWFDADYVAKEFDVAEKTGADVVYANWRFAGEMSGEAIFQEFNERKLQLQQINIKPESLLRASAIKDKNGELKLKYFEWTKRRANDWVFFVALAAEGLKFVWAKESFVNYRIKSGSMSSSILLTEEMEIFAKYLDKLGKIYGEKIVSAREFLISKVGVYSEYSEIYDRKIKELSRNLDAKNAEILRLENDIKKQNDETQKILNSNSYKIGKITTAPLRIFREK